MLLYFRNIYKIVDNNDNCDFKLKIKIYSFKINLKKLKGYLISA